MKQTQGIRIFLGIIIMGLAAGTATARDILPILKAGSQTYTNVEVLQVSDTQLFFQYPGGMSSVKLKDLDPELQKTFGYDPAHETENAPLSAQEYKSEAQEGTNAVQIGMAFKDVRLSDGRVLRFCLPKAWSSSISQSPEAPDFMILHLEHPFEKDFIFSISVMPKNNPFARLSTQDATSVPGFHELKNAVEKDLVLNSLNGPQASGHYYALTRKFPGKKPACKSEGVVRIGDLTLDFMIESNDLKGKEPQAALEVVRTTQLLDKP